MFRLNAIAFAIKKRLEESPELKGKVVVLSEIDIESKFRIRMEKMGGACVVVRLLEGKNFSRNKLKVRFAGAYTVTLFMSKFSNQSEVALADRLLEEIPTKIHGWWPDEIPSNGVMYCDIENVKFPEDTPYYVAVLTVYAPRTTN